MLIPVSEMKGEDEEDTRLLQEYPARARDYITSFRWCPTIRATYFAEGVGAIFALFLIEFEEKMEGTDDKLWVIVGDLPPLYLDLVPDDCPQNALETYCLLMDDWIAAVRDNGNFDNVCPVSGPRTGEYAGMLKNRLIILREEIIPWLSADIVNAPSDSANEG